MKLTVSVTQDDIQFGKKGNCDWCPIAHAVRRVVPEKYIKISVGKRWLVLWPNDVIISREVELPEVAKTFIKEFDRGLPVSPFTFEIDIPCPRKSSSGLGSMKVQPFEFEINCG